MFQKTLKHTRFGRISVKCYYDAPEQRLTVEILHAADIIALDANGKTAPVWVKCSLFYRRFHSVFLVLVRSQWPVCHSGALSTPPVPYGQESTHTSEAEDPAPSVRWTLLLVSTVFPLFTYVHSLRLIPLVAVVFQPRQPWAVQTQVRLFDLHCDGLWLAVHQRLCRWSRGPSQRLLLAGEAERLASREERPALHPPPVAQ